MFARIEIDRSRCKGCGICTTACPRMLLELEQVSDEFVSSFAVLPSQEKCVGCTQCAVMYPDLAIDVYSRQKNEFVGVTGRAFRLYSNKVVSLLERLS